MANRNYVKTMKSSIFILEDTPLTKLERLLRLIAFVVIALIFLSNSIMLFFNKIIYPEFFLKHIYKNFRSTNKVPMKHSSRLF